MCRCNFDIFRMGKVVFLLAKGLGRFDVKEDLCVSLLVIVIRVVA